MADTIEIELITYETIKSQFPYWNIYPLMERMYSKGKRPQMYHIELDIDTSTADTPTESTAPTNIVFNFGTPKQIYIRSSAAADTSKRIYVIGEKATGTDAGVFKKHTLTSNAVNGTTAVDCDTWNFIAFVEKYDTWAGNAIIDNNGASGTVYWTAALGATATTGIVIIPTGYNASILEGAANLTNVPAANANGVIIAFGHSWNAILDDNNPEDHIEKGGFVATTGLRVALTHNYKTAVTTTKIHMLIIMWEQD